MLKNGNNKTFDYHPVRLYIKNPAGYVDNGNDANISDNSISYIDLQKIKRKQNNDNL